MIENTAKYISDLQADNAVLKKYVETLRVILATMREDAAEREQMMDDNMINDERNTDWD